MGALYRSEEMTRCQLFLQTEAAYACVAELGELGLVQFRDLNPDVSAFQRKFVNEVRRCDEMERKLRYLEREIKKDGIPMLDTGENPDAPQPREMIDLEATFEKLENELREVNSNEEMLKKNFLELTELKHILRKTQAFFDEGHVPTAEEFTALTTDVESVAHGGKSETPSSISFVAGVIFREKLPAFERLLWRACHGNVFLRTAEIDEPLEDPTTGDQVNKSVFIIFFQGEQLKSRVKKICEGFRATLYPCPETPAERREMAIGVMTRIEDLKTVLGQTQDHRHRVLVAAAKNIRLWFVKVQKIKAIYHTLNLFNLDVTQKCLIAECWCPVADLEKIQLALKRGTEESGSSVPSILHRMQTSEPPPTYFRTNKFTVGFQAIVDAYGIATYQEINPAPYTIITFPFLFAVMFGDIGHGLIMFLFALFLVLKEKMLQARKIQDEIFQTFFGGRYIILLMGIFSMYTGLIYNDVFSRSINIFGTGWRVNMTRFPGGSGLEHMESVILDPATGEWTGSAYPLGMDPIWNLAENKLLFLNSFKMKMSVIMGILQMMFGVLLSLMNYRYFNQRLNIYCQFIPQMIFLTAIFFYLCIMIFYKWTHFGPHAMGGPECYSKNPVPKDCYEPTCAPSLLIGLINMFMFKSRSVGAYRFPDPMGPGQYQSSSDCANNAFYGGQTIVEAILVILAVVCIPWMLFVKPFVLRSQNKKRSMLNSVHADMSNGEAEVVHVDGKAVDTMPKQSASHGGHGHDGEFSFGDIFIHQAIHTIEFCLGCVSHTASYLRLWALSLAHAELSEVLWEMVLKQAFNLIRGYGGAIVTYVIFFGFAVLTVAILVVMEGLSAFLHALRLHWVEFNSKFYIGDGHLFMPFSFDIILEQARSATEEKQ